MLEDTGSDSVESEDHLGFDLNSISNAEKLSDTLRSQNDLPLNLCIRDAEISKAASSNEEKSNEASSNEESFETEPLNLCIVNAQDREMMINLPMVKKRAINWNTPLDLTFKNAAKKQKHENIQPDISKSTKSQMKSYYKDIKNNVYIAKYDRQTITNCDCVQSGNMNCSNTCINRFLFVECSPQICYFKERCQNMIIQNSEPLDGLAMRETAKGFGLFTERAIKKETFLIEYVGQVITKDQFKLRSETSYADQIHSYGMALDRDLVIDATKYGNKSRFINHSCSPNCEIQKWTVNGLFRMAVFSIRDIDPNEELCFDYKFCSLFI